MNYINVIQLFESFAQEHLGVRRFKSDTADRMEDFTNSGEDFPLLYTILNNTRKLKTSGDYSADIYNFNIYSLVPRIDIIPEDDDKIILNQTNRNLSTCYSILSDLVNWLDSLEYNWLDVEYSSISQPVNNITKDKLQGVYITVQLSVLDNTKCYIPFENAPIIPSNGCTDITYPKALTCETLESCPVISEIQNEIVTLDNNITSINEDIITIQNDIIDLQTSVNELDLQDTYDNSVTKQIEIVENGSLKIKNSQTLMTSSTQEWLDENDIVVGKITGQGELSLIISYITVELIDALTTNFYAPNNLSIESVIDLLNTPTTSILVNDVAYVLGDPITSGDKITVTVDVAAVVKLVINNVI